MMKLAESLGVPGKKFVKIEFTRPALMQWNMLSELSLKTSGVIVGTRLGTYRIIENLCAVRLNRRNLNRLYPVFLDQLGSRLMGVFFMNSKCFLDDWFLEGIVISFNEPEAAVFWYHVDQSGQKKILEKIG